MPHNERSQQPLLTIKEIAAWLSVSVRTVEKLIAWGEIIPIWVLGQRRFTRQAIEAYFRASERRAPRRKRLSAARNESETSRGAK